MQPVASNVQYDYQPLPMGANVVVYKPLSEAEIKEVNVISDEVVKEVQTEFEAQEVFIKKEELTIKKMLKGFGISFIAFAALAILAATLISTTSVFFSPLVAIPAGFGLICGIVVISALAGLMKTNAVAALHFTLISERPEFERFLRDSKITRVLSRDELLQAHPYFVKYQECVGVTKLLNDPEKGREFLQYVRERYGSNYRNVVSLALLISLVSSFPTYQRRKEAERKTANDVDQSFIDGMNRHTSYPEFFQKCVDGLINKKN